MLKEPETKTNRRSIIKKYLHFHERGQIDSFLCKNENDVALLPLEGDEELFSSFNPKIPSEDAIEYLVDLSDSIPKKERITISLSSSLELSSVENRFKDYIAYIVNQTEKDKKKWTHRALFCLFLGVSIILSSYFFASNTLFAETLDIIGCVLVWHATEYWFFDRRDLNQKQLSYLRLYASKWEKAKDKKDV